MLHFLAAVALCLFIGERIVRYWSAWRLRRDERRYRAMLYPTQPPSQSEPGWSTIAFCLVVSGAIALPVLAILGQAIAKL